MSGHAWRTVTVGLDRCASCRVERRFAILRNVWVYYNPRGFLIAREPACTPLAMTDETVTRIDRARDHDYSVAVTMRRDHQGFMHVERVLRVIPGGKQ